MWKLWLAGAAALVLFMAGFKSATTLYNIRGMQEKVRFLEDQAAKFKDVTKMGTELSEKAAEEDKGNEEIKDNLIKELAKSDTPDRTILPDTWMRRLERLR